MLWKSLSARACSRFLGFSSMARARLLEAILRAPGDGVQQRQAVKGVVRLGMFGEDALELLARLLVVAGIQLRNGVVVVLLGGEEAQTADCPSCRWQVLMYILQRSTISMGAAGSSFSKAASAFSNFPCCTQLHGGLVVLEGRPRGRGGVAAGLG